MNDTINYYNKHAEQYYQATVDVDFTVAYDRFLKYVSQRGKIIDMGCGSGRDVAAFIERGYEAIGVDASKELAELASGEKKIPVMVGDMTTWIADEPVDGIWCCASLLHLQDRELKRFIDNLCINLKRGGALYVSVKSGVVTGFDDKGRYMRNFTESELEPLLLRADIEVVDRWITEDKMNRDGFQWINVIGVRK